MSAGIGSPARPLRVAIVGAGPSGFYTAAALLAAKDVEVSVEDSTLTVSGTREFTSEVAEESYHRIERRYGSFSRAVSLPPQVDTGKVDARFEDGVLSIEVPKVEKARPKKIQVKGAQKKAER